MLPTSEGASLISIPYARRAEARASRRYFWDCQNRGGDSFVILQATQKGAGLFRLGGKEWRVGPGQAFVTLIPEAAQYYYPPNSPHPWVFSWINFYGELSLKLWREFREVFGPVIPLELDSMAGLDLTRLIQRVEEKSFRDRFEASEEAYKFYMELRRQLSTPGRAVRGTSLARVQRMREPSRDPVSVKELAAQSSLSREHFSRLFKLEHGVSPAAFFRRQRLKEARELLFRTALPVREVALRCGFYSPRHFAAAFLREYGKPPQAARRRNLRR